MSGDRADTFAGAQQIVFFTPGRRGTNASIQIFFQLADFLFKPVDMLSNFGSNVFRRGMQTVFSAHNMVTN